MENGDISQMIDALIRVLHENGALKSAAVEQAFRNVPRHLFLPNEPLERVYQDIAITVKESEDGVSTSASSQPTIMAAMLEQLALQPGMRVLEIGAGTGYNAALMAYLVGETGSVVTVVIQPDLVEQARANLDCAGFERVQAIAADGGEGYPPAAPYDRIILTASSWVIPPAWREQLKDGGRIVLPLSLAQRRDSKIELKMKDGQRIVLPMSLNGPQKSIAFDRQGEELFSSSIWDCGFMPLQGAFTAPPALQIPIGPGEGLILTSLQPLPVEERTFSQWLAHSEAYPTGVNVIVWELLTDFLSWLTVRSPDGSANLSAVGEAVEAIVSLALIAFKGQEKRVETFLKILPGSAAAMTRPPEAEINWHNFEQPEENTPEQPFEVYVRQLGPNPEAAQLLVRLIQEWDAAERPNSSRLRLRGIPAGKPRHLPEHLPEGEYLIERPWTHFIAWYQD